MTQDGHTPEMDRAQRNLTLSLAGVLGGVGCLTVVIILVAVGAGLWLDNQFQTRPLFALVLILGSVPLTIYLMVRIVLYYAPRITAVTQRSSGTAAEEETGSGETRE
jgi:F0F1-type ATP synthase assembly protein I